MTWMIYLMVGSQLFQLGQGKGPQAWLAQPSKRGALTQVTRAAHPKGGSSKIP